MVAVGYQKYGSETAFNEDPLRHLYDVYVKATKDVDVDPSVKVEAARWFKRMEDGDENVLQQWRNWSETSLERYKDAYDRLNIQFDVYTGESKVTKALVDKVLVQLEGAGLILDREGAKGIDLNKWGLKMPIVRKTGSSSLPSGTHF